MKYHLSARSGEWKECRAAEGNCPFGDSHATAEQIAATARGAHERGEPTPVLLDTAGKLRRFTFHEDGGYTFGARRYDRKGAPVLSERTQKAARLKLWAEFRQWSENERAERFDAELLAFEVQHGALKGSNLTGDQFQSYADEHHGGSARAFFAGLWKSFKHAPTVSERYRLTLEAMAQRVWQWLKGAAG